MELPGIDEAQDAVVVQNTQIQRSDPKKANENQATETYGDKIEQELIPHVSKVAAEHKINEKHSTVTCNCNSHKQEMTEIKMMRGRIRKTTKWHQRFFRATIS